MLLSNCIPALITLIVLQLSITAEKISFFFMGIARNNKTGNHAVTVQ